MHAKRCHCLSTRLCVNKGSLYPEDGEKTYGWMGGQGEKINKGLVNICCHRSHLLPKPIISEGKCLDCVHRNCAGNRFSDRLTSLLVFQAWDDARMGGEEAGKRFCEHKRLSMAMLKNDLESNSPAKRVYLTVCCHKEKRKILNTEGHNALHKSSVSCRFSTQNIKFEHEPSLPKQ
ncbi:ATP-dependent RNA helicase A isoform X2 [Cygnus olor]|uniref:ATP-dependent RNA helicase A isoform X2 n=1 Tax=Cygnus olor TaxID=8869 RepID=UPI001ADDF67F|nr:ATP-dependent RNA helicase A isoform X2 [Cygnus olor]